MEKITEARISSLLAAICKSSDLVAEYQEGSPVNGRCWRVTFAESVYPTSKSRELVGLTRWEIYDMLHAFWAGVEFAKSFYIEQR